VDADGNRASYYQKIRIRELAYDNLMSETLAKTPDFFKFIVFPDYSGTQAWVRYYFL